MHFVKPLFLKKGVYTKFSDIDGIIYRFPQPFSLPVDAIGRPLALSEVRKKYRTNLG